MEVKLSHFSHEHPLLFKTEVDESVEIISCVGCLRPISGPYYACEECCYYMHMVCAKLPKKLNHPIHFRHPLTLHANKPDSGVICDVCSVEGVGFVYNCSICSFDIELRCAYGSETLENKHHLYPNPTYLLSSFPWHLHPLVLKPEEYEPEDIKLKQEKPYHNHGYCHSLSLYDTGSPDGPVVEKVKCDGCSEPISGPTYSCEECGYYLHKVCAELPSEMNHPMHPNHSLTLLEETLTSFGPYGRRSCAMCGRKCDKVFYSCHICKFDVDLICASSSNKIQDKCHTHPLSPIQFPNSFHCHICHTEEKRVSYKCTTCPFWVHQNCTLLPTTLKLRDHVHQLTLLDSVPSECHINFNFACDICHGKMTTFETTFSCSGCLFFAHPSCAMSLEIQPLRIEDYISQENSFSADITRLFPVGKEWTSRVESISKGSLRRDYIPPDEIEHFCHIHKLCFHEEAGEKICEACARPISDPSYGCIECDYFLHKWCAMLRETRFSPYHPRHYSDLLKPNPAELDFFRCTCCRQLCNGFGFQCPEGCDFTIDLKCALLTDMIKHQSHEHFLIPKIDSKSTCSACNGESPYKMKCEVCNFILCQHCVMLPPVMNHRYCDHGLTLQYSPIKNYDRDYICDFCEEALLPKWWFYHCGECHQFAHPTCLTKSIGSSDIKFGKRYTLPDHEHVLTLTPLTYDYINCTVCRIALYRGLAVGFECSTCEFKIHLECIKSFDEQLKNERK